MNIELFSVSVLKDKRFVNRLSCLVHPRSLFCVIIVDDLYLFIDR